MPRWSKLAGILTPVVVLIACNAPEAFYTKLGLVPQVDPINPPAYAVGDTMTLTGKLGGPHAHVLVTVGGVNAPVIAQRDTVIPGTPTAGTFYNFNYDLVSVVITQAMGIGPDRPVTVTINGIERDAGLILIATSRPFLQRKDTLAFFDTAFSYNPTFTFNTLVSRGDLGDGRVYLLTGDTLKRWQSGGGTSVLLTSLSDQYGSFHNIGAAGAFNTLMGVDETGRYLYASLVTDSTPADTGWTIRLIKVDLSASTIQTLNRTFVPFSLTPAQEASLSLTGPVGQVFLPPLTQIFPAANGTIYFVTEGFAPFNLGSTWVTYPFPILCSGGNGSGLSSAVGKIDPSGAVSYVIKAGCGNPPGLPIQTANVFTDLLPTLTTTHAWDYIYAIDPDAGIIYATEQTPTTAAFAAGLSWGQVAYSVADRQPIGHVFAPGGSPSTTSTVSAGSFLAVNGEFGPLGLVRGSGHRVWTLTPLTNSTPEEMAIVDFDAGIVFPYVHIEGNFGALASALYYIDNNGQPAPIIINHTPAGDPIIAAQAIAAFNGLLPDFVIVPHSTSAGASHIASHPHH
jgi:hypothetical protein